MIILQETNCKNLSEGDLGVNIVSCLSQEHHIIEVYQLLANMESVFTYRMYQTQSQNTLQQFGHPTSTDVMIFLARTSSG